MQWEEVERWTVMGELTARSVNLEVRLEAGGKMVAGTTEQW